MPLWDDYDAAQQQEPPPDMWGGGGRGPTRLTVYARPPAQPEPDYSPVEQQGLLERQIPMWANLMQTHGEPPAPVNMWPDAPPVDPNYQRDPFEAAALRNRMPYRNIAAPGQSNLGPIAEALAPTQPWEYGLMPAFGGVGLIGRGLSMLPRAAKVAAGAAGVMLTPEEAQAGIKEKLLAAAIAANPAALGQFPTTTPGRIVNQTTDKGGYSVHLPTGKNPTEGYMMGKYANDDLRNLVVDQIKKSDVVQHAETNKKVLAGAENYFGTWLDPESGKTYFDVSQRFAPDELRKATKYGERTGQKAGWDVTAGKTIPVGNWEEFIKSPEFATRMDEMANVGREYLKKFPAKEWWDLPGTAFERVYGKGNLPQVAGFTATTAPNTKPIENLQVMSEYMRRHIKGEPTVQPDWRVPEGTMSRQAGTEIGMEKGRANNLRKTAEGRLDLLQKDKVREEAAAMMGDKNAVVLDRHWARIGEAPERGIFTNVEEGVVKDKAYQTMKDQVVEQARKVGRDPRDYSADVWTGIRETIQKTSELYGTKYKGSAITGESKSYADHFEDLLRKKAEHLKISQPELERRLRMGDADLLAAVLSTPAIYALYKQGGANRQEM